MSVPVTNDQLDVQMVSSKTRLLQGRAIHTVLTAVLAFMFLPYDGVMRIFFLGVLAISALSESWKQWTHTADIQISEGYLMVDGEVVDPSEVTVELGFSLLGVSRHRRVHTLLITHQRDRYFAFASAEAHEAFIGLVRSPFGNEKEAEFGGGIGSGVDWPLIDRELLDTEREVSVAGVKQAVKDRSYRPPSAERGGEVPFGFTEDESSIRIKKVLFWNLVFWLGFAVIAAQFGAWAGLLCGVVAVVVVLRSASGAVYELIVADERLWVRRILGKGVSIPLRNITRLEVESSKGFKSGYRVWYVSEDRYRSSLTFNAGNRRDKAFAKRLKRRCSWVVVR